jgi:hypothetical protein
MNPKQSIGAAFAKQNKTTNVNYRVRVTTSLIKVKYLLQCGFLFRGSHESHAKFDEDNTELLQCIACLSQTSSFAAFDVDKLLRMVELYQNDFKDMSEVVVCYLL